MQQAAPVKAQRHDAIPFVDSEGEEGGADLVQKLLFRHQADHVLQKLVGFLVGIIALLPVHAIVRLVQRPVFNARFRQSEKDAL